MRSSLDDKEKFAKSVDYFPERVEFGVARPELLKLLIRPLYGDRPEIGIRELLQNAVDAVQERWAYEERHPEVRDLPKYLEDCDVEIWLDDPDESGYATLTVTDNGIGMTEEIVRDYFLTAGASYRYSDAWRKEFEKGGKSVDATESRVMRSGRFGIGVLAAFLLGDEIEVTTRRVGSQHAIRFNVESNKRSINIKYLSNNSIGTTISVKINTVRYTKLTMDEQLWDWFHFAKPKVNRLLGSKKCLLSQRDTIPQPNTDLPCNWRRIEFNTYQDLQWTYDLKLPALVYNGIKIMDDYIENLTVDSFMEIVPPNISVTEYGGAFPLDLNKCMIGVDKYPFNNELAYDVFIDHLAMLIVRLPFDINKWNRDVLTYNSLIYKFEVGQRDEMTTCDLSTLFTRIDGVILFDKMFQGGIWGNRYILSFQPAYIMNWIRPEFNNDLMRGSVCQINQTTGTFPYFTEFVLRKYLTNLSWNVYKQLFDDRIIGVRIVKYEDNQWYYNKIGNCGDKHFNPDIYECKTPNVLFVELHLSDSSFVGKPSPLAQLWLDIIGPQVIPFDPVERRTKLAKAYDILAPYIKAHKEMKREEDAKKAEALKKAK